MNNVLQTYQNAHSYSGLNNEIIENIYDYVFKKKIEAEIKDRYEKFRS
jgi:lysine/ornithine N-monooxygenase